MKVLIVRFAAIGDCVMTAWAATALRNAVNDLTLYWATQERCSPVLDTDRLVDTLHVFPRERWKAHRWSPATWVDQLTKYTALRKHKINVGFDFQGHSKTALCLRLAGCRERYASRATDALAKSLNPPLDLEPEGSHEVQLALALVQHRISVAMPLRPLMPRVEADRDRWLAGSDTSRLITLQTGAGEPDKLYPPDLLSKVALDLMSEGWTTVAVGGPRDPRLSTGVSLDTVGKATLRESMALVAASRLHIAGDTGTGHIASAYGVPTVSVFSRTDPERFRPWGNGGKILRSLGGTSAIAPGDVVNAARSLLVTEAHARPH